MVTRTATRDSEPSTRIRSVSTVFRAGRSSRIRSPKLEVFYHNGQATASSTLQRRGVRRRKYSRSLLPRGNSGIFAQIVRSDINNRPGGSDEAVPDREYR